MVVTGRPAAEEAAAHFAKYIALVEGDDAVMGMERQLEQLLALLKSVGEEKSLYRYGAGKWSLREMLNHVSDTERAFSYRALWIGRGFKDPLLGFDQTTAVAGSGADEVAWAEHVEEFRRVRLATIALFRNLPEAAWSRSGVVNGHPVSVRALAFITVGHAAHHEAILRERYL